MTNFLAPLLTLLPGGEFVLFSRDNEYVNHSRHSSRTNPQTDVAVGGFLSSFYSVVMAL